MKNQEISSYSLIFDILQFRKMLAPQILKVIFGVIVIISAFLPIIAFSMGGILAFLEGLFVSFFLILISRIIFEFSIVVFSIHESLEAIRNWCKNFENNLDTEKKQETKLPDDLGNNIKILSIEINKLRTALQSRQQARPQSNKTTLSSKNGPST